MRLKEIDQGIFYLKLDSDSASEQNELMIIMLKKKYYNSEFNFLILDIAEVDVIGHSLICFVLDLAKILSYQPQNLVLVDPNEKLKRHLSMLHLNGIIESYNNFENASQSIKKKSTSSVWV